MHATRIVASLDDAKAVLNLPSFLAASPRLAALAFWARAPWANTARGLVVIAAAAADVAAIDGPGEAGAFRREALYAREMGFSGKIATNAEEVAILNAVFAVNGGL